MWGGTPELVEAGLRIAHGNLRGSWFSDEILEIGQRTPDHY